MFEVGAHTITLKELVVSTNSLTLVNVAIGSSLWASTQMKEKDVLKFLATGTYLDGTNLDFQMKQYICKRKADGIHIISLKRFWERDAVACSLGYCCH